VICLMRIGPIGWEMMSSRPPSSSDTFAVARATCTPRKCRRCASFKGPSRSPRAKPHSHDSHPNTSLVTCGGGGGGLCTWESEMMMARPLTKPIMTDEEMSTSRLAQRQKANRMHVSPPSSTAYGRYISPWLRT
jgi:hypothetical protein